MNQIFNILPEILFFLVAGIFILAIYRSVSRHPKEKGLTPIYSKICTAFFDGQKRNFTRVTLYDNFIVISNFKKYILRYAEITSVKVERIYFFKCLSVTHKNSRKIPTFSFSPGSINKLKEIIESKTGIPNEIIKVDKIAK